jgi:ectoine hydroxylase-related dioxygenase (phytanoyl-CoA dioxygenase family)
MEVRDVSDEEVDFYTENGWVMLRGLLSEEVAAELLRLSKQIRDEAGEYDASKIAVKSGLVREGVEPFRSLGLSPELGAVAQRLINRRRLSDTDVPVRWTGFDAIYCKVPGARGTPYHQDSTYAGADRMGVLVFWIALDEVTQEMGAMRFLSGVHREGPLGDTIPHLDDDGKPDRAKLDALGAAGETEILQKVYPRLWELYELSPPFHYRPGDATVHNWYMLHGGPPNTSDRDRWSWHVEYAPADTRWASFTTDDVVMRFKLDLDQPIVYPGA